MGPKKRYGQHFLTAPAYARRIAEAVPARPSDHVLEIGPGQGALSIHLKERFPGLHLVEIDPDVIERLRQKLGAGEYILHRSDILDFDFATAGFPLHVVGNLPYNIGAMIIRKTLLYGNSISSCTFMVQREVAERIVAPPHTRSNGFLTVFCGFFGAPRILFHVPPGAFFPRPSVDSSVFQLAIEPGLDSKLPQSRWEEFFSFVDRGFSMRRKQLAKVLALHTGSKERYASLLERLGVGGGARAEDLDTGRWLELFSMSEENQ